MKFHILAIIHHSLITIVSFYLEFIVLTLIIMLIHKDRLLIKNWLRTKRVIQYLWNFHPDLLTDTLCWTWKEITERVDYLFRRRCSFFKRHIHSDISVQVGLRLSLIYFLHLISNFSHECLYVFYSGSIFIVFSFLVDALAFLLLFLRCICRAHNLTQQYQEGILKIRLINNKMQMYFLI